MCYQHKLTGDARGAKEKEKGGVNRSEEEKERVKGKANQGGEGEGSRRYPVD